jgi:hypothetical protein
MPRRDKALHRADARSVGPRCFDDKERVRRRIAARRLSALTCCSDINITG